MGALAIKPESLARRAAKSPQPERKFVSIGGAGA